MRRLGLCVLFLAACGGTSTGGDVDAMNAIDAAPPDATPTVTIDDLCGTDGVYAKMIARLVTCNPGFELLVLQGQATPQAVSAFCHGATDPYRPATIDLPSYAELQACLAYVANTACNDLDFNATACNLFHGKVADAQGCDSTEQCKDTSYCDRPNPNTCGTCTPRLADGMTCTVDEQCANGKCVGTQCGHPGQDGDPCVISNGSSDDCLGQRRCNPQTNKCETKAWQLNDTCAGLGDCGILQTDLWCKPTNPQTFGGAGQCAHYLALGATCNPQQPGAGLCDLTKYEWCNPNATGGPKCSPPNIVQDGKVCSMFQGDQCAPGLVCSNPLAGQQNPAHCYTPAAKDAACGAQGQAPCGLFLGCVGGKCEYTNDTPKCP
jgi:hypothetical protein